MSYCVKCGNRSDNDSAFCPYCGTPKAPPTLKKPSPVRGVGPAPYTPMTPTRPAPPMGSPVSGLPAMDLGTVSMILNIMSMAYGVIAFFAGLFVLNSRYSERNAVVIMVALLFTLPIGILGMIFCNIAKKQGINSSSVSTGTILGGVSMGLYALSFLLCIVCMV